MRIFELFGGAFGLRINMTKTSAMPIRCSEELTERISSTLGCTIGTFPCRYISLPLFLRKLIAAQLHDLVNQVATKLPSWRGATLPKSSRLILVKSVLSAIPIHAMLALDLPPKMIKAIIKICRGFLWCGKEDANGGKCAVAWKSVCTPRWAGGLGIPDLQCLNYALQVAGHGYNV